MRRGEAFDAQARVEEQDADVGRRHQVLDVAVGARHGFELCLQLGVDGLQLLVDRLQLLLARLQLLGGRTVLLVDRLQFLVGGAQLLVRALVFLARGAQLRLGELQLLLKLLDLLAAPAVFGRGHVARAVAERLALEEEQDRRAAGVGIRAERFRLQIDAARSAVEADGDRAAEAGLVALEDAAQGGAQVGPQFLARQFRDVVDQRAAGRLQIAPDPFRQMDDAVGRVDDRARRGEPLQRLAVRAGLVRDAECAVLAGNGSWPKRGGPTRSGTCTSDGTGMRS